MWTLDEALTIIRFVQPMTRKFKYHVALGGGVLNNGYSDKDADIYFLPCCNDKPDPKAGQNLRAMLELLWGESQPIGSEEYPGDANYQFKIKFLNVNESGKRIDAFIV